MSTEMKPRLDLAAEMRRRCGLPAEAAEPLRLDLTHDETRRVLESERRRGEIEHGGEPTGLLAEGMRELLAARGWPARKCGDG